ncbi:phosphoglycolate phosphatase [Alphaproteobacteria bacterium AO1-B]|nr:phosphoglycolate phosphatase [Alphaproteobacteria bacterium AO1-B]
MACTIKAILFDKDGTLLDFDATWATPQEQAASFAANGDELLSKRLLVAGGMDPGTRKTAAGSLFAAGNALEIAEAFINEGAPRSLEHLTSVLDRIFLQGMQKAKLLPGLETSLHELHNAGYILGVASSDSEASIAAFLRTTGITDLFSFIAGYDSGHGHKPGPGMVKAFSGTTGIPVSQIAVAGDNTHDLEMAKNAGAGLKIGVLSGTGTAADLSPLADLILESCADLSEQVLVRP